MPVNTSPNAPISNDPSTCKPSWASHSLATISPSLSKRYSSSGTRSEYQMKSRSAGDARPVSDVDSTTTGNSGRQSERSNSYRTRMGAATVAAPRCGRSATSAHATVARPTADAGAKTAIFGHAPKGYGNPGELGAGVERRFHGSRKNIGVLSWSAETGGFVSVAHQ